MRKEETSCASCGSKGVGWKVSVGGFDEEEAVEVEDEDLRPVNLSQIDMTGRYKGGMVVTGCTEKGRKRWSSMIADSNILIEVG